MTKSITLELPEGMDWVAQDYHAAICAYDSEPDEQIKQFLPKSGDTRFFVISPEHDSVVNENWRDSKINLNTHGAYIDADGILRRYELVPDMGEGWKPIETTPKDGTRVELMNVNNGLKDEGYWCDYRHIHGVPSGEWCQDLGNGGMTHWREPTLSTFKPQAD